METKRVGQGYARRGAMLRVNGTTHGKTSRCVNEFCRPTEVLSQYCTEGGLHWVVKANPGCANSGLQYGLHWVVN